MAPGPPTSDGRIMPSLVDHIETPDLRRLYSYWDGLRRGRDFPARRDIDPLDFPYALGQVILLDVLYTPLRFRFRLHGTTLVLRAGYDMTGKMADELPHPRSRDLLVERCRTVVETRGPAVAAEGKTPGSPWFCLEGLWLPLSEDGETISMVMAALFYRDPPARGASNSPCSAP